MIGSQDLRGGFMMATPTSKRVRVARHRLRRIRRLRSHPPAVGGGHHMGAQFGVGRGGRHRGGDRLGSPAPYRQLGRLRVASDRDTEPRQHLGTACSHAAAGDRRADGRKLALTPACRQSVTASGRARPRRSLRLWKPERSLGGEDAGAMDDGQEAARAAALSRRGLSGGHRRSRAASQRRSRHPRDSPPEKTKPLHSGASKRRGGP
jgi:hypothetical protein